MLKTKTPILMLLISSLGIVIFLIVTEIFPFKSKLFSILYAKPLSQASEGLVVPVVELTIDGYSEKQINLTSENTPVNLSWAASNVKSCIGRAWGLSEKDNSWIGSKNPNGGKFQTVRLTKNNAYVYTIDCANEFGDAAGDAVVINIGAPKSAQSPYVTSFGVFQESRERLDLSEPIPVSIGEEIKVSWTTLNLSTPYSVCFATGSWPAHYQNASRAEVVENFTVTNPRVYRYSLFCSNEVGIVKNTMTLIPE